MRARLFVAFSAGLLFGLGLVVSRMFDPAKVLGFLDITGNWDPSLALVMGGALPVAAFGFRLANVRPAPLLDAQFHLGAATRIDARLIVGALVFGVGWGLVGYCPGPALTALAFGRIETAIFVIAMIGGMAAHRFSASRSPLAPTMQLAAKQGE